MFSVSGEINKLLAKILQRGTVYWAASNSLQEVFPGMEG
jgi:hypothetical protein